MGLNKSKGNMYSWVTHTWNTIKGQCPHDCSYCYMKRWGKLNPVRLDKGEFKTNLGSGNFIFVGSSCDMFANEIPDEWIKRTLEHCFLYENNRYLFQSKNPGKMTQYLNRSENVVLCTTIETNRWYQDIMRQSPSPYERAIAMFYSRLPKYITIEPIMDFDLNEFIELVELCEPQQVNIGADSGNNGLPEPPIEKVYQLIDRLQEFTTISKKRNLQRLEK